MPGYLFVHRQECSWYVWHYIYKTEYLRNNQRKFREHILFEDSDFILGALAHAHKVQYIPIPLVYHFVSGTRIGQITSSDMKKLIEQRLAKCIALKNEAMHAKLLIADEKQLAYKSLMHHFSYSYGYIIMELLWRFPYKKRNQLFKQYPSYYEGLPQKMRFFNISFIPFPNHIKHNFVNKQTNIIYIPLYSQMF